MGETEQEAVVGIDDITVAIAEADDRAGAESTLDDIAPATAQVVDETPSEPIQEAADLQLPRLSVPIWPFLSYVGLWLVFAASAVWQLLAVSADQAVYDSQAYGLATLGGVLMTAMGPLLALLVWIVVWRGAETNQRAGLFSAALVRGALATFCGVVVWWAALILVDTLRLGRPF